ncbi:MAG: peptidase M15 [Deltaproteobacteria bacterium]|nr:peptidase M15 [Deltaproteobacteria bacterium]
MLDTRIRKCPENHHVILGNFEFPREFACKCGCGACDIDWRVWYVCQLIRIRFNAPVTVRSACRCDALNQHIGGSPRSDHLYGWAADIVVQGIKPDDVARFAATLDGVKRIGVYEPGGKNGASGFVHTGVKDRGQNTWRSWRFDPQRKLIEWS